MPPPFSRFSCSILEHREFICSVHARLTAGEFMSIAPAPLRFFFLAPFSCPSIAMTGASIRLFAPLRVCTVSLMTDIATIAAAISTAPISAAFIAVRRTFIEFTGEEETRGSCITCATILLDI